MKISVPEIYCHFQYFNDLYFDGILPVPGFRIIHSHRRLGYFDYLPGIFTPMSDPRISISDGYLFTYEQLRDIIVHEMIHYYLAYTGEDKMVTHGKRFRAMAQELNSLYDLDIQVTYDISNYYVLKLNPFHKIKDLFTW